MRMDERDERAGNPQIRRRTVVAGLAFAGAAVTAGVLSAGLASADDPNSSSLSIGAVRPGALLPGTQVQVVTVHAVTFGALPVVLEAPGGERFQVDVLARDPAGPQGVGNTEHYSVYVSNRGDGETSTNEAQGLGAMALARVLEGEAHQIPPLQTLRSREAKHAGEAFGVPLRS